MPVIDMDFGSVLPPEGEYDFMVSACKVHTKKGTTNKSLLFETVILGPTCEDAKVAKFMSLLPQARAMLQQWLQGLTGDKWDQDGMAIDTDELIGLTARGVLVHQEYQGTVNAQWSRCYQDAVGTPFEDNSPFEPTE